MEQIQNEVFNVAIETVALIGVGAIIVLLIYAIGRYAVAVATTK